MEKISYIINRKTIIKLKEVRKMQHTTQGLKAAAEMLNNLT